jgi:transcriptional regulator with XRE-family HTH domain
MQAKMNIPANFSERLSLAISRDGRTKAQIAESVGVKPPALSRWLAGSIPDHENAKDLAAALNVSVHWLLNGEENFHLNEEPGVYRATSRPGVKPGPVASSAPDLLHACTVVLGGLAHANNLDAFGYAVQGFEEIWERYKAAKLAELR